MAEELALDQVLGDRAAVDGHERAIYARAAAVQLLRDQLLAGARLAGDENADVGRGDLLELAKDLEHRGANADDFAEFLVLELGHELGLVGAERVEQHRVLEDERGLRGEDAEQLELGAIEEVLDLVVADVERADDLALREQRGAHDARELHGDHALALAEVGVGDGVGHDDGAGLVDHLADDAVGDLALRVGDRLLAHVARGADAEAALFALGGGLRGGLVTLDQEQEALVGVGQLDHVVEHGLEQLVDVAAVDQSLAERKELAHARELGRDAGFAAGFGGVVVVVALRLGARLGEHGERELDRSELDAVAVDEPRAALALAVDGDLGVFVELFEREIAAVEEDLRVMLCHAHARDGHVVAEGLPDRGERFVDAVDARGARRDEVPQCRHRRPS